MTNPPPRRHPTYWGSTWGRWWWHCHRGSQRGWGRTRRLPVPCPLVARACPATQKGPRSVQSNTLTQSNNSQVKLRHIFFFFWTPKGNSTWIDHYGTYEVAAINDNRFVAKLLQSTQRPQVNIFQISAYKQSQWRADSGNLPQNGEKKLDFRVLAVFSSRN